MPLGNGPDCPLMQGHRQHASARKRGIGGQRQRLEQASPAGVAGLRRYNPTVGSAASPWAVSTGASVSAIDRTKGNFQARRMVNGLEVGERPRFVQ
ncbi:hypothetical protein [Microvirga sp. VF16]|uniref:hypothetical protein n=1 Tax=Microvirga sp. VF16 TaxID=2807101 RepID=UPI00193CAC04|nr:hypothetical protein [Microvirga sp. VF16]QRM32638.1 hypothetical protein JO965_31650 [Microvirga sp. VF16]